MVGEWALTSTISHCHESRGPGLDGPPTTALEQKRTEKSGCAGQMPSFPINKHGQIWLFGEPMEKRLEQIETQV
jgi:hypothetical protein